MGEASLKPWCGPESRAPPAGSPPVSPHDRQTECAQLGQILPHPPPFGVTVAKQLDNLAQGESPGRIVQQRQNLALPVRHAPLYPAWRYVATRPEAHRHASSRIFDLRSRKARLLGQFRHPDRAPSPSFDDAAPICWPATRPSGSTPKTTWPPWRFSMAHSVRAAARRWPVVALNSICSDSPPRAHSRIFLWVMTESSSSFDCWNHAPGVRPRREDSDP